ncbi:MAG: hypothetical protein LC769_09695, partial [Chloroflexi bacterium]|nr:hypothetical protein [Chloroflexota bacterium]
MGELIIMLIHDEGSGANAAFQPVRLAATPDAARLTPGGRGVITVSVRNASSIVDRYRIAVDGVSDDWYDLDKRLIALFPGAEERVTLTLHPPTGTTTMAGDYVVTVRAVSGIRVDGDGEGGASDPLLTRPALFTFVPRYTALSLPRWIRRIPTWALRLLALLLLLLLLGAGAGLGQVLGKAPASQAVATTQTPRPTGPLPRIKQLTVQVGPRGELLARWTVAGTTDVRLNGRAVAPSGQQAQHVTGLITLVLVARGAGGTVTQMLRVAPSPVAVTLPASALSLPVIHFTARTDPRTHKVALVWSVTGAKATLLNNAPVAATAHQVITPGQTTYTLRASNGLGTVTMRIVLRRIVVRMPAIDRFDVVHQRADQPYRLIWRTRDAVTVTLNGQRVGTSGALILRSPVRSMAYRLVADNVDGQATALMRVDVRPALAPPARTVALVTPRILA